SEGTVVGGGRGVSEGMGRIAIWIANTGLGVLCCFLLSRPILFILESLLLPSPTVELTPQTGTTPIARLRDDRQVILRRNLFNVSTLAVGGALSEEEALEATKLPLRLLGTAASVDARLSWAAVEDLETHQHTVVRIDDVLRQQAKVVRIERRRIVLENGARREELALEKGAGVGITTTAAAGGSDPNMRVKRLADNRFAVARSDVENAARNPATLFSQARILPKYENGQMVGVQLNSVQPGSLFEQIGIQSGDTVTTFNGVRIDRPEQSANLLRELTEAHSFNVTVQGSDGRERTLTYDLSE
ncbi:MAG TPA: type II secretion system protein GspC, partial [Myxococcota bacterium]|nr:type II secretion system protein GspC [Myxococcota bacterium]